MLRMTGQALAAWALSAPGGEMAMARGVTGLGEEAGGGFLAGSSEYLRALAIVLISIVCAKLAAWVLSAVISRWTSRTRTTIDDRLVVLCSSNRPWRFPRM